MEISNQLGWLVTWWSHWDVFLATDLCLLGIGYCLWRTRSQASASFSKFAAMGVACVFFFSLTAGASVANQMVAGARKMDVEAQAQLAHPVFHDGWWYAISSAAGPQWTQVFDTEKDCQGFVAFSRGVPFVCHQKRGSGLVALPG